mgnify:CR=1 FL=1
MCGENPSTVGRSAEGAGSSPRVRGKPHRRPLRPRRPRLIPACAGKTGPTPGRNSPSRAHPRVCGENRASRTVTVVGYGSSPRVRGKRMAPPPHPPQPGLIPACAGKTGVGGEDGGRDGAHPRVCGENGDMGSPQAGGLGSSPRVRGKPIRRQPQVQKVRLIPACAGKTPTPCAAGTPTTAHPRVCGENLPTMLRNASDLGSSPRVRGKRPRPGPRPPRRRLIPACAGKTEMQGRTHARTAAHPRVCGENRRLRQRLVRDLGSSPRVRGKRDRPRRRRERQRLIPACAGKTAPATTPTRRSRAHPRVCGENIVAAVAALVAAGSSPRVRGKHRRRRRRPRGRRLIPACAGKTVTVIVRSAARQAHPRVCGENQGAD